MIFVAVDRFSRLFSIHAQGIPWSLEVHVKEKMCVRHSTSVLRSSRVGRRVGREQGRVGRQQARVEREAVRNARAPKARAEGSRDIAASNMSRLKRPSAEGAS